MNEIYHNIYNVSIRQASSGCAVIHAFKTCHQKALKYTKSLPQSHPHFTKTHNTEFKTSLHDAYLKWVCDFADANGVVIYIISDCGPSKATLYIESILNCMSACSFISPEPTNAGVYFS